MKSVVDSLSRAGSSAAERPPYTGKAAQAVTQGCGSSSDGFVRIGESPDSRALAKRFWRKVRRLGADECWPWKGALGRGGRGVFYLRGRTTSAPRVVFEIVLGSPLPADVYACHRCDNPRCCNPAHLFAGTRSDNMLDMYAKGRGRPRRKPRSRRVPPPAPTPACLIRYGEIRDWLAARRSA